MTIDDSHPTTKGAAWYEQEDLWRASYPFFFTEAKFQQAAEQVDPILVLASPSGRAVLDLCCGPGRFAIPLSQRGFHVTAVDRTRHLLEKAAARAGDESLLVDWVEADMRRFVRPRAYDLALSMFTSFGYFEDKSDDEKVLANVFESLKPGGRLLIETFGKELIAARFADAGVYRLDDGTVLFEERRVVDDWTRIHNQWTLVSKEQARTFDFTLRVYSGEELRELMARAGFERVALYGNFDGAPYDRAAARLIAVGEKSTLARGGPPTAVRRAVDGN